MRSESDKEKTKLRERQRRAITRKIFSGLRKHGGYNLSPRADINEVLRHLAMESGWTILPDGTTYRSHNSKALTGPTPATSSAVNCSTTNSPQPHFAGGSNPVEATNINIPMELFMSRPDHHYAHW